MLLGTPNRIRRDRGVRRGERVCPGRVQGSHRRSFRRSLGGVDRIEASERVHDRVDVLGVARLVKEAHDARRASVFSADRHLDGIDRRLGIEEIMEFHEDCQRIQHAGRSHSRGGGVGFENGHVDEKRVTHGEVRRHPALHLGRVYIPVAVHVLEGGDVKAPRGQVAEREDTLSVGHGFVGESIGADRKDGRRVHSHAARPAPHLSGEGRRDELATRREDELEGVHESVSKEVLDDRLQRHTVHDAGLEAALDLDAQRPAPVLDLHVPHPRGDRDRLGE